MEDIVCFYTQDTWGVRANEMDSHLLSHAVKGGGRLTPDEGFSCSKEESSPKHF